MDDRRDYPEDDTEHTQIESIQLEDDQQNDGQSIKLWPSAEEKKDEEEKRWNN